jgi:proline iminopeptidase
MARNKLCAGLLAAMAGGYLLRRQGLRWGATDAEVHKPLPGDEVVLHPMLETTHAVSIDAAAEEIWPWLVQMGYYRAGWYADPSWWDKPADEYLRSLSRKEAQESGAGHRNAPSAERIVPELQDLEVGDTILDGPPDTAFFTVHVLEPNRALVLYSDSHLRFLVPRSIREDPRFGIYGEFSWAFVLEEQGKRNTRLIQRTRSNYGPRPYRALTMPLILVGGEVLTARKMLNGIKRRAEDTGKSTDEQPASNMEDPGGDDRR